MYFGVSRVNWIYSNSHGNNCLGFCRFRILPSVLGWIIDKTEVKLHSRIRLNDASCEQAPVFGTKTVQLQFFYLLRFVLTASTLQAIHKDAECCSCCQSNGLLEQVVKFLSSADYNCLNNKKNILLYFWGVLSTDFEYIKSRKGEKTPKDNLNLFSDIFHMDNI